MRAAVRRRQAIATEKKVGDKQNKAALESAVGTFQVKAEQNAWNGNYANKPSNNDQAALESAIGTFQVKAKQNAWNGNYANRPSDQLSAVLTPKAATVPQDAAARTT